MRWGQDFLVACALIVVVIFLLVNLMKLAFGIRNTCKKNQDSELVRRAAVYTIASDPRGNNSTNNFSDFFWDVSPQNTRSNELSKDDKDLPSYEEVMRMEIQQQVLDSTRPPAPITTLTPENTAVGTVPTTRLTV